MQKKIKLFIHPKEKKIDSIILNSEKNELILKYKNENK